MLITYLFSTDKLLISRLTFTFAQAIRNFPLWVYLFKVFNESIFMSIYSNRLVTQMAVNGKHCMSLLVVIHGFMTTVKLFTTANNWATGCVWKPPLTIFEPNQIAVICAYPLHKTKLNVQNLRRTSATCWYICGNRLHSPFYRESVAFLSLTYSSCSLASNPHLHCHNDLILHVP